MNDYVKYDSQNPLFYHHATSDRCDVDIHIHDYYEIFQATSNNVRYFVEGHGYDLQKHDLIITSSKEIHRPTVIDINPYGRRFIQFDPMIIPTYMDLDYNPLHIFENRILGHNNHLSPPQHALSLINQHFQDIGAALVADSPRSSYEARLLLIQFSMVLEGLFVAHSVAPKASIAIDSRVYQLRKYLDQHFIEAFDLDRLSQIHHMDKYYMSHLFKENTGFTLLEYVQSKRILQAKTLLKGKQTIAQISQQCGYEDYTNFYKTFKKLIRVSPKEYRVMVQ